MNIQIREAKKEDVSWIVNSANQTRELWSSKKSRWFKEEDIHILLDKRNTDTIFLIAEADFSPVGFILVQQLHVWAICFGLYVTSDFRSKGIGKQLLKTVENILLTRGIQTLDLLVERDNRKALGFYKREGFDQGFEFYWMSKTL